MPVTRKPTEEDRVLRYLTDMIADSYIVDTSRSGEVRIVPVSKSNLGGKA